MARSKSSNKWLREHFNDEYVKRSRQEGYRSRAVYKLAEIQDKDRIIRPGMVIVDLGAAPGSWSQYVSRVAGKSCQIIAMDLLDMEPLPGVEFIQGDFCEESVLKDLLAALDGKRVDLVMSDIAPNMSGVDAVDIPRSMYLAELAVDFSRQVLQPGGGLLMKVFQGEGFDELVRDLRDKFQRVVIRKPKASRPRSREVYALATKFTYNE
ncbi:MAG: 23S rRNA (uridine(2552)-2'-O)-methyltransferase RlmE [Gammaproteobacteria bacterium]